MAVNDKDKKRNFASDFFLADIEKAADHYVRAIEQDEGLFGDSYCKKLKDLRNRYCAEGQKIVEGDFVCWKQDLKNKKLPEYGQPSIVMEVLDEPVIDLEAGPGSPYFKEELDVILGFLNREGDFSMYYFDSRRFEKCLNLSEGEA